MKSRGLSQNEHFHTTSVIPLVDQCVICGIFRPVVLLMLAMVLLCETKSGVAGTSVEGFFWSATACLDKLMIVLSCLAIRTL